MNKIIVLSATEVKIRERSVSPSNPAYYFEEAITLQRELMKVFGLDAEWKGVKVIILITPICGCCGGWRSLIEAFKALNKQGFTGKVIGRTVGDQSWPDDYPDNFVPAISKDAAQIVEMARQIADKTP